jgi:hypothetical protein
MFSVNSKCETEQENQNIKYHSQRHMSTASMGKKRPTQQRRAKDAPTSQVCFDVNTQGIQTEGNGWNSPQTDSESEDSTARTVFPRTCLKLQKSINKQRWTPQIVLSGTETRNVGRKKKEHRDDSGFLSDCPTISRAQLVLHQIMIGENFTLKIEATNADAPFCTQVNGRNLPCGVTKPLMIGDSVTIERHNASYSVKAYPCEEDCRQQEPEHKVQELTKENTPLQEPLKGQLSHDGIESNNQTEEECTACKNDKSFKKDKQHDTTCPDCWFYGC